MKRLPDNFEDTEEEAGLNFAELLKFVREYLGILKEGRTKILGFAAFFLGLGLFIAFGSTTEYTARMSFLPYKLAGSSNGLGGLAGLAGIKLPDGTTAQVVSLELYPEVVKTLTFKRKIAESPIYFSKADTTISSAEYFKKIYKPSLVELCKSYLFGFPSKVANHFASERTATRSNWTPKEDSSRITSYSESYLSSINRVGSKLSVNVDKKTLIMSIEATMPDPHAAAALVKLSGETLMQTVIDYESKKAHEQVVFLENQHLLSKQKFERLQGYLAAFNDRNRNTFTAGSQADAQRLQNEFNMAFDLYKKLSVELEQAKIKENQDTPVFTVLEDVFVPIKPIGPKRGKIIFVSIFLGLILGVVYVIAKDVIPKYIGSELV